MTQLINSFKDAFKARKKKKEAKELQATIVDYTRRKAKADAAMAKLAVAIDGLHDMRVDTTDFVRQKQRLQIQLDTIDANAPTDYKAAYKLLDTVKAAAYEQSKLAAKAYKETVEDPQARVDVDVNGKKMQIHPKSVPGFENLTRDQRTKALVTIGGKIETGKALVGALMDDPGAMLNQSPERENVTDMMWYLKSMAEEKAGEAFLKGTLTLPDEGYMIRGYLDRCTEVYNRLSSHMKDHQEKTGGSARGIDFYEGDVGFKDDGSIDEDKAKLLMPYGMNTLLIQSFTIEGTGEQRLMLKMETEGARLGLRGTSLVDPDTIMAEREDSLTVPQSRPIQPEDRERTIEHGKNAIKSIVFKKHDDGGLRAFREDLGKGKAKEVLAAYTKCVDKSKKPCPQVYQALNKGDWKTNINVMCHNFGQVYNDPNYLGATDEIVNLINAFVTLANEMHAFGDLDSRVGNEVALSKGDMT
jgi:hypothetical protein